MKSFILLTWAASAMAGYPGPGYGGTGPFKSYYFEVEALPNHTFYQPLISGAYASQQAQLGADGYPIKLPVLIWGNGGCDPFGAKYSKMLGEVVSYGALAIATGPAYIDPDAYEKPVRNPNDTDTGHAMGQDPEAMTQAIDWVMENAGKGEWAHIDSSRIGIWGQSCGGLETYAAGAFDDRVNHLGIYNSGNLDNATSLQYAAKLKKPVFYILGGPTDVAYVNGEADYNNLPEGTPAWKANHALGHSNAFYQPDAGIPGVTGRHIMQWMLRGNVSAKEWFTGPEPKEVGFVDVNFKSLENVNVTPIGGPGGAAGPVAGA